jgi:ribonucleoside-diphosphate reductase alpha chain
MGLKAVAIYRDGSKRSQPVTVKEEKKEDEIVLVAPEALASVPARHRLPDTRRSLTHKFSIQGHEGYLTVGLYEDGAPGELFITMAKEGSTIGGLMDSFGTAVSLGLQYGVPLKVLVDKFIHSRFEPSGFTQNPDIPMAKSLVDYLFRWLGREFVEGFGQGIGSLPKEEEEAEGEIKMAAPEGEEASGDKPASASQSTVALAASPEAAAQRKVRSDGSDSQFAHFQTDAPSCDVCGSITVRNGNCYRCHNCGNSMGCS